MMQKRPFLSASVPLPNLSSLAFHRGVGESTGAANSEAELARKEIDSGKWLS